MQKIKRRYKNLVVAFALLIASIFSIFGSVISISTFAISDTIKSSYSNILDDLKLDENFNVDDYPSKEKDYSLQVIQVAETKGGEVLVYVYQPCAETMELSATKISVSRGIFGAYSPELYDLTLLNSNGVFQKYRIDNFPVLSDDVRHYEISEIMRAWNEEIDDPGLGGNIISNKAFPVAQRWTACTLNDKVYYDCVVTDVVEITDMFVGFVEYEDGYKLFQHGSSACQSHYVAFNSDHDMDTLLEADVTFTHQSRAYDVQGMTQPIYGKAIVESKWPLTHIDTVNYTTQGTFTHTKYEWNRIETPQQFFKSVETNNVYKNGIVNVTDKRTLEESDKNIIKNMQYVLRFYESSYSIESKRVGISPIGGSMLVDYVNETAVTDVAILRLKFEYEGKIYNLGVVSDMQSGDGHSSSSEEWSVEIAEWFKILLVVVGILAVLIGLLVVLNILGWLKPIFEFLLKVGKGIWWLITAPFTFLKSIIKKE